MDKELKTTVESFMLAATKHTSGDLVWGYSNLFACWFFQASYDTPCYLVSSECPEGVAGWYLRTFGQDGRQYLADDLTDALTMAGDYIN